MPHAAACPREPVGAPEASTEDIGMHGLTFRQQVVSGPFLVVLAFMAVHVLQVNFYVVCAIRRSKTMGETGGVCCVCVVVGGGEQGTAYYQLVLMGDGDGVYRDIFSNWWALLF